jgi:hypothetical protein
VVSLTSWPLYPGKSGPGIDWRGAWVGTGTWREVLEKIKIEPRFLDCPACSLVTILTELSHIQYTYIIACHQGFAAHDMEVMIKLNEYIAGDRKSMIRTLSFSCDREGMQCGLFLTVIHHSEHSHRPTHSAHCPQTKRVSTVLWECRFGKRFYCNK